MSSELNTADETARPAGGRRHARDVEELRRRVREEIQRDPTQTNTSLAGKLNTSRNLIISTRKAMPPTAESGDGAKASAPPVYKKRPGAAAIAVSVERWPRKFGQRDKWSGRGLSQR